jgi:hypothetical protein
MNTSPSRARLAFRNLIKAGVFFIAIGILGLSAAMIAGLFVLGDLSGTLQPAKVSGGPQAKGLIPVRYYVEPGVTAASHLAAKGIRVATANAVPAPLVAPAADASTPEVRVARAIPVLGDIPVRRAQPVLLTVPQPAFNARAAVADDEFIPRARAVSPAELERSGDRPYQLPAGANVAQRDALNW